jgi:hypothetical protein
MRKVLFFSLLFYCCVGFSQVGIGTVAPNTSTELDVVSTDKGVLLPRIALTGIDDITTISNGNTDALLIYNTATIGGINEVTPGFYYWSAAQNKWIGLTTIADGAITNDKLAGDIDLTTKVTGVLPVIHGGTGVNTLTGTGSVVLSDSPTFIGVPQAPTPAPTDNSTTLATTAFVQSATFGSVGVIDAIQNGVTTIPPSQNAVFDALVLKENTITATSSTDYYRGDKTFQTLDKTAVGLENIDNTSDADKPVSTATQTALDLKADKALLDGKILIGNTSNLATAVTPNGDVTVDNLGETTIGDSKVTYAKIQNISATNRVLGRTSVGSGIVEEIVTTGTGNAVMSNSPTLIAPNLDTPTTLVGTNITGTASGLTAGIANTVSSGDESADTTSFPLFVSNSGTQTSQPKSNTSFKFNASTGQLATNSFSSSGLVTAAGFFGTGGASYAQNNNAKINGNISLNSGTIDSPGIHFYSGDNSNWGIDNSSGALRFVKDLDQAGGVVHGFFTASGSFLLQASSVIDPSGAALVVKGTYPKTPIEIQQSSTVLHNAIVFRNTNGSVGVIRTSGTTTAYVTSSDENLKKNIVEAPEATTIARKMRTISYNFKLDDQFIEFGLGARELYKVYPEAVSDPKDSSWGVEYGRLVPILLKYTQEVDKRVIALEAEKNHPMKQLKPKENTALILEMVKNLQEKVDALQKELNLLKNKN